MLLGVPKKLKPGMPVMRSFGSKSLNLGTIVRDLISLYLGERMRRLGPPWPWHRIP